MLRLKSYSRCLLCEARLIFPVINGPIVCSWYNFEVVCYDWQVSNLVSFVSIIKMWLNLPIDFLEKHNIKFCVIFVDINIINLSIWIVNDEYLI